MLICVTLHIDQPAALRQLSAVSKIKNLAPERILVARRVNARRSSSDEGFRAAADGHVGARAGGGGASSHASAEAAHATFPF